MMIFDLRCIAGGEVFEGWFSSSADYSDQHERGLLKCPVCGSSEIEKAPMAPRLHRQSGADENAKSALAKLASLQERLLKDSTWVGKELPEQARAMHLGEIEPQQVHGEASVEEAKSLMEEGVPLLPLPLPVVPPAQVN